MRGGKGGVVSDRDCTEPDYEGTLLARLLGARPASGMASPSLASPVPSAEDVAAPEPVTEAMVDAAITAAVEYQRGAREAVWASPSRGQVRAMLEGAARAGQERGDEEEADREPLGRIVRETWVGWALEQPDVADHPSWTEPWGKLAARDREVDMRIGAAVAAAERERIAGLMDSLAANYPENVFPPDSGVRDAIGGTAMRHAYRNAARTIREPQERGDEKEAGRG